MNVGDNSMQEHIILIQLCILRLASHRKAMLEVDYSLSCLYQTKSIIYTHCTLSPFLLGSPRTKRSARASCEFICIYICVSLRLMCLPDLRYLLNNFFLICYVIGSTWSTRPKGKFSWFYFFLVTQLTF